MSANELMVRDMFLIGAPARAENRESNTAFQRVASVSPPLGMEGEEEGSFVLLGVCDWV